MFTPLPTPEEMSAWDAATIRLGLPAMVLMENAAREALDVLRTSCGPLRHRRVILFMGGGNNGGDAAAVARGLHDLGACTLLVHTRPLRAYRGETAAHLRLALRCGVPAIDASSWLKLAVRANAPFAPWHNAMAAAWKRKTRAAQDAAKRDNPSESLSGIMEDDTAPAPPRRRDATIDYTQAPLPPVIVDGLLGTGLRGPVRERERALIRAINALRDEGAHVFSLDIPSGVDGLTGRPAPEAVHAHVTVTFEAPKTGIVLPEARCHVGALHVRPIGIPRTVRSTPTRFRLMTDDCTKVMPVPRDDMHKGTAGHVLIIGGSPGLTGAPHLAARAALRGGAGFATIATPGSLATEAKCASPDVMTLPLGVAATWPDTPDEALMSLIRRCSVLVVGPGMGRTPQAAAFASRLLAVRHRPPAIVDADALHALATGGIALDLIAETDIVTPHPGEAALLLGWETADIQRDRPAALAALMSRLHCTVILKGACTLVGSPGLPVTVSPRMASTLAVAGSGDVLAGLAGALVAQGATSPIAACLSVNIHGKAGEMLLEGHPQRGCLASDIADALPRARKELCHA